MNNESSQLDRYISPLSVWALSFGSAVGWGAFVMPGTTFIPIAGPLGTAIGMVLGALIMFIIGVNYHFMMNHYGDEGGTYSYTKHVFGHDHAFLNGWFLSLTYVAIVWANVTALALIARNVTGTLLQFGFYYSIAGYTIYLGEVLFEIVILLVAAVLCILAKKAAIFVQCVLAIILILGVIFCFVACVHTDSFIHLFNHAFDFQNRTKMGAVQILSIAALSPWAFVGFESVSHYAHEFSFSIKKSLPLMTIAIFSGFIAYVLLTLIAVPSYGLVSMPVFYSVRNFAGKISFFVLFLAVFAGILTGIIGNSIAASRLLYALAKDGIIPEVFKRTSKSGVPKNALLLITATSIVMPFLGGTPIGWIVDVTTIGATIAYGYTSAAAFKTAKDEGETLICVTGIIGLLMAIFFSLFLLVPNFWSVNVLAPESYLILAVWSIIGFVYFRSVFAHDKERRFGKSTVVWIALLFLIFFTSIMWVRENTHNTAESVLSDVSRFYADELRSRGISASSDFQQVAKQFLDSKLTMILDTLMNNSLVQLVMIVIALAIMFSIYSSMKSREKALEAESIQAQRANEAKTVFLSNMSHDIRTPMNAIIGYTRLARRENNSLEEIQDFLAKIDKSSKHLLALINDVLEMSRIESGKMEIENQPCDLREIIEEVHDIFSTQMATKRIEYTVDCTHIKNPVVKCDRNRLNRILLNLIGNAYKFTSEGGKISVTLSQLPVQDEQDVATYELRVKDNGIGMSKEFAERVFEAFERERNSTVSGIQGTGLGMAITKSIIDLMGGEIKVQTEQGKGTEFIITLNFQTLSDFPLDTSFEHEEVTKTESEQSQAEQESGMPQFAGKRALLVDDVEVNREIAVMVLQEMGFTVEAAANGKEAVDKVSENPAHYFDVVLMDIQMPVMNGYEATKHIRNLVDSEKASVPIVAMTANAFEEDKRNAFMAGMNAHVAKPIDEEKLISVLKFVLHG
ncbi:MAG: amino acid permease [Treponema sp.]|nr:amino acid permease [Treponema sp.]